MKRRLMMWMTIVCILVVGGSVTKMTREFVVSQGVEAAAVVNVMDAGDRMPVAAAGAAPEAIVELETVAETAYTSALTEETAIAEVEEEAAAAMVADAVMETVKSPLDPVVVNETVMEAKETRVSYHAEDFFERFAQTEQNALQLWDNVTSDNRSAYLAAAEQERVLWDYELNHIYQVIRERLSTEEIEELKILEVEWIKERDLYAEKAIAKSGIKNAQNQNPDYTRALAEKTKERCYWLVSEYEDVLNQD